MGAERDDPDRDLFDDDFGSPDGWEPPVHELEITDVLDLHSFPPQVVKDVLRDWLDAAWDKGFREVRVIHGRGIGVQRRTVRTLLERDSRVISISDAPPEAGGWGATLVQLG